MSVKKLLQKPMLRLTANSFAQRILEKRVKSLLKLTGIGSGGTVETSGEIGILKFIKTIETDFYCIFDVGANKGDFSQLVLDAMPPDKSYEIHCFEPSKVAFGALQKNLCKNTNISLNNFGLGKEKGQFELFTDHFGSGGASLTRRHIEQKNTTYNLSETVLIDTLDDYCREVNVEKIDLLKLDVEGHELDVLFGATDCFESKKIKSVSFEFGGCNIDTRTFLRDFFHFFKERRFQLFRVTPHGYLHRIEKYTEQCEQFRTANYLAVCFDIL